MNGNKNKTKQNKKNQQNIIDLLRCYFLRFLPKSPLTHKLFCFQMSIQITNNSFLFIQPDNDKVTHLKQKYGEVQHYGDLHLGSNVKKPTSPDPTQSFFEHN